MVVHWTDGTCLIYIFFASFVHIIVEVLPLANSILTSFNVGLPRETFNLPKVIGTRSFVTALYWSLISFLFWPVRVDKRARDSFRH